MLILAYTLVVFPPLGWLCYQRGRKVEHAHQKYLRKRLEEFDRQSDLLDGRAIAAANAENERRREREGLERLARAVFAEPEPTRLIDLPPKWSDDVLDIRDVDGRFN